MKLKSMKKVLAAVLSTTMVMGMSMTVLAADGEITSTSPTNPATGGSITAPIFSYDITHVVVPTSYGVAFNPDGLNITVSTATTPAVTTTSPVASKNYGIINKSSKDKLVKVGLSVSSTAPTGSVTFVDTAAEATGAAKGEYKIYLEVVPADATDIKVYDANGNEEDPTTATTPSSLAHVKMTKAASTATVPMKLGDNEVAFKLGKAEYSLKKDGSLNLEGGITDNDVKDLYKVTDLDTDKGVTGFTFDGAMNSNADWTKVTGKVEITPTYTIETTDDTVTVLDGTGAMTEVGPQVSMTAGGLITMSGLTAEQNKKSLKVAYGTGEWEVSNDATWDNSRWSSTSGGTLAVQLGSSWMGNIAKTDGNVTVKLTLTDNTVKIARVSIPTSTP